MTQGTGWEVLPVIAETATPAEPKPEKKFSLQVPEIFQTVQKYVEEVSPIKLESASTITGRSFVHQLIEIPFPYFYQNQKRYRAILTSIQVHIVSDQNDWVKLLNLKAIYRVYVQYCRDIHSELEAKPDDPDLDQKRDAVWRQVHNFKERLVCYIEKLAIADDRMRDAFIMRLEAEHFPFEVFL